MNDTSYRYAIAHPACEEVDLCSADPPDQFVENIGSILKLLGYKKLDELPIAIYVQRKDGEIWQPIYGVDEGVPVLFPMATANVTTRNLTEEDYYSYGKKILSNYIVDRNNYMRLTNSENKGKLREKGTSEKVKILAGKIKAVESAVLDTNFVELFTLKYKSSKSKEECIESMHISARTYDRWLHEMTVHIGMTLYHILSPRKFKELV